MQIPLNLKLKPPILPIFTHKKTQQFTITIIVHVIRSDKKIYKQTLLKKKKKRIKLYSLIGLCRACLSALGICNLS